jgi:hypothetical protein
MWSWLAVGLALAQVTPPSQVEISLDLTEYVSTEGAFAGGAGLSVGAPMELGKKYPFWLATPEVRLGYIGANFPQEAISGRLSVGIGGRVQAMAWHGRDLNKGIKKKKKKKRGRKRYASTGDVGPYLMMSTTALDTFTIPPPDFVLAAGVAADYRQDWFVGGCSVGWAHGFATGPDSGAGTVSCRVGAKF